MNYSHARDTIQQAPDTPLSNVLLAVLVDLQGLEQQLVVERSRIRDLQREVDELKQAGKLTPHPVDPPVNMNGAYPQPPPPLWPCPVVNCVEVVTLCVCGHPRADHVNGEECWPSEQFRCGCGRYDSRPVSVWPQK